MSVVVTGPIGGFSRKEARLIEFDFNLIWENKVNREDRRCVLRLLRFKEVPEEKMPPLVHFG